MIVRFLIKRGYYGISDLKEYEDITVYIKAVNTILMIVSTNVLMC